MDNSLVLETLTNYGNAKRVLILVVMDNSLVQNVVIDWYNLPES